MDTVRIGIIGIGNMGSAHVRNIQAGNVKGMEVSAVCDRNRERGDLFPDIPFFERGEDLISNDKVDAVLVATPHYDHTTLGISALEAGKHLLVEKPISVHKADCERLIGAHTDDKLVFAAMFNQRTDPRYRKLKELIASGQTGRIQRVVWNITDWFRTENYYASGGWRATWKGEGGGVLLNQCPHQLDLWQWLFGMPDRVRAFCELGRYHDIEVEDDVTCYMEYKNGCKGVFITTTGEAPGTNRLEITAENGKIVVDSRYEGIFWTRNEVPMSEWSATTSGGFSKPPVWDIHIPVPGGNGPQHLGILRNFADAVLDGKELIAPAEEGIHSVELANAMLFSGFREETLAMPIDAQAYADLLQEKIETSTFQKKKVQEGIASDFDNA
ncbi:MAG: Gfo/Idh/MocA family oxidoreductase [Verrucomicrobia bacterium]|jgi:predicted dehydrogenase|nr:Gfo/Idh/MocA family oxidoreductase [Verrucomicrobiota bacterium]